jgi:predicted acylesterase/phospholipase RssA
MSDTQERSIAARTRLEDARREFRARVQELGAPALWSRFRGRIAAVLAGGGARGSYEAGALLAVQDAGVPTHLITATSIGSINGASFAAHAEGFVGNAEPLVKAWFELTPPTVGVEWTRYAWMIAGLLATAFGIANLTYYLLDSGGYHIHLHHPAIAWFSLCLAGLSVLLFYEQMPYVYYVLRRLLRRSPWRPDRHRVAISIGANLLVLAFVVAIVESLHSHTGFDELLHGKPLVIVLGLVLLFVGQRVRRYVHPGVGHFWGRLLRLPFRTGIFSNFERIRFLRRWIPTDRLRDSQVRIVFTATDLDTGNARYFTNVDPAAFIGEYGVDEQFVTRELVRVDDLMPAIIASSALPIAYEPLLLDGHLHGDGAIVNSQPIRPAIRLGADVLLLISMESPGGPRGDVNTFVDVGLRALDILIAQNVQADVALLRSANHNIEVAAGTLGIRPEDVVLDFEGHRFRYVKAFTIRPEQPIRGTILEFGGRDTEESIIRGYVDAAAKIAELATYADTGGFGKERQVLVVQILKPGA